MILFLLQQARLATIEKVAIYCQSKYLNSFISEVNQLCIPRLICFFSPSSSTQQATWPDVPTAEECEYTTVQVYQ